MWVDCHRIKKVTGKWATPERVISSFLEAFKQRDTVQRFQF